MPRLLKAAEEHSFSLGYRWNPAKCVVLNSAFSLGGPQLKLYDDDIPIQSTFNYLGVPFDDTWWLTTQYQRSEQRIEEKLSFSYRNLV
ncbi:hypothetical protein G6F37_013055 [Rhizopus arrhizus]|nr:hypothetical protein G6F37_013055 [Rhizopus arrhizus]